MCSPDCIRFGEMVLRPTDVRGKAVLEVGSYNVNGSLRSTVHRYQPQQYVGVDLALCDHQVAPCTFTPCVDRICGADNLLAEFGPDRFDLVISTEMLEHVQDWRKVIHNLKGVLKPGGLLILTTRSPGFSRHDFPADHWRFTYSDMQAIFSDFTIEHLQGDPSLVGIFVSARKADPYVENDLSAHEVYSMEKDTTFYFLLPRHEQPCTMTQACGRRFFTKFEDASTYCQSVNAAIGPPLAYFGVVEACFVTDTECSVKFRD